MIDPQDDTTTADEILGESMASLLHLAAGLDKVYGLDPEREVESAPDNLQE